MPFSDLFKSKEELEAEQKKLQKKELRDANRSCDRIQADLDRQAKELESQIKAAAGKNDTTLAKTLAKQLIRVRNEKVRAIGAKSKISTIASQANSMNANNKLAGIMASSASAMTKVNQQMKPEELAKQMGQFQAETMKMDMKDNAMQDMFDELFEEEDEEADSIMNQVLDELSIETSATLSKLPATSKDTVGVNQVVKNDPKAVGSKTKEQH